MTKPMEKARWSLAALVAVGIAVGCAAPGGSTRPGEATGTSRQALASSNGLGQNGLTTNGLWANGLWANGLWANGLWANGLWANGLWANGLWANGLWANGLWANGLWANGLWANGLDLASGVSQPGSPSDTLRSSPYLRQLLQYVYACAMPRAGTSDPDGGAPLSFDTTLDPNGGKLACTPPAPCGDAGSSGDADQGADAGAACSSQPTCDIGYTCDSQTNTCVVPLTGAIGLGINADGSTWWGGAPTDGGAGNAGRCDETCQRWVSACVLARTNAYGVHVEISMRAPANAPQAIQDALKTTPDEVATYTLREGAYYGNIFATRPVNPAPTQTDGGPYSGTEPGPIAETPTFNACAGPGSNIPEITKRFCSSQGDQVVINVPGVCETTATETGVCDGLDATGSIYGCYGSPDPTQPQCSSSVPCSAGYTCSSQGTCVLHYDQVITVYLKTPISVCGNAVCEPPAEDATSCPSDCNPGWAKDYAPSLAGGVVNQNASNPNFVSVGTSALAPDDTVVVAGTVQSDIDLGGGTLSASQGVGVLAKYHSDGSYAWGVRFGNTAASPPDAGADPDASTSGAHLQEVNGVTVASRGTTKGNITVVGLAVDAISVQHIWISTYTADGVQVGTWILPNAGATLQPTRAFAVDSQGNIVLAGDYLGTATFGSTSLTSSATFPGNSDTYIAKISPPGPDAALSPPAVVWAQSLSSTASNPTLSFPLSVVVDSTDNVVLLDSESSNNDVLRLNVVLRKLCPDGSSGSTNSTDSGTVCPDGSTPWTQTLGIDPTTGSGGLFSAATVDANGNVYVTGYGQGGGQGDSPFIEKYDTDGNFQWANYANNICFWSGDCATAMSRLGPPGLVEGVSIGFDPTGNVILGSFGDPSVGGGINFGVELNATGAGTPTFPFPTFPTYHSNNIFVSAYSPDVGRLVWAKQVPTILSSDLLGMAVDSQGRVVVSGNYSGSMQVGGRLLVTPVPEDPDVIDSFLASFGGPSPLDKTPPAIGAGADQTGSPIFTVPNNIFTQATSSAGAVVFFMPPTAIDTGNAGTSVVCSPPPNTTFPIGTTTVTCTASDPLGNQSSATFTVTVADTLAPVFSTVAAITAQATNASGATVTYTPTATDQVDGAITPVCTPASGSVFAVGTTTVTCTASDSATPPNSSQTSFTVTVTAACPPTTCSAQGATCGTISDGCGGTLSCGSCTTPQTCGGGGTTNVCGCTPTTCSAQGATCGTMSNGCGGTLNCGSCAPKLTLPGPITATATSVKGAVVTYSASATDPVDGSVKPVCTPASGSTFALGATTVSCTATDAHGNTATGSFQVHVQYAWSGVLKPIDPNGSSVFELGSTVPVKFQLTGASAGITNALASLSETKISSTIAGTSVTAVSTSAATTGNAFRYDATSKQYIFNLATKGLSVGSWQLSIDLHDGVSRTVKISLKREQ